MIFSDEYYRKHFKRLQEIERLIGLRYTTGNFLELGATEKFQVLQSMKVGADCVFGTVFSESFEEKITKREYIFNEYRSKNVSYSINLESELFPVADSFFEFVLCSEVIEHLDVDPMFMLKEINRITKIGGCIIITTPNCTSARNLWKIANGYRPHFFMQYERSRSPYRHNIEYDVHSVKLLLESTGYEITEIFTKDVFEETLPQGLDLIHRMNLSADHRGDCIFCSARKIGPVINRWPSELYV